MDIKPDLYPAPRYRRFLKKVRVEVIDFRFHEAVGEPVEKAVSDSERYILSPFMGRLRALLGPAGGGVTVNIKLQRDWRSGPSRSQGSPNDVISLETIWPLTKGRWKCYIHTEFDDNDGGREFKCKAFGERGQNSQVERSKMQEFEEASVVGDCYFAIVRGRVRLVRNGMRYSCCYGCERRYLDMRRLGLW